MDASMEIPPASGSELNMDDVNAAAMPDLFQDDVQAYDWWVIHAKSRCEKKIADECNRRQIRCYLPLYKKYTRNSQRTVCFDVPLFSGYLFMYTDGGGRLDILRTNYSANIFVVENSEEFLNQIRTVHTALSSQMHVEPFDEFQEGTMVRVTRGPLAGAEGPIIQKKTTCKLILKVDFIQKNVAVEVDIGDVEKI